MIKQHCVCGMCHHYGQDECISRACMCCSRFHTDSYPVNVFQCCISCGDEVFRKRTSYPKCTKCTQKKLIIDKNSIPKTA